MLQKISVSDKYCSFELSETKKYHHVHTIKQHNIDDKKCFIRIKSAEKNQNDFWRIMWHWRLE